MKSVLVTTLFSLLISGQVFGQQEYFSDKNKAQGIAHFKKKIKSGCVALKEKQDPVSSTELKELSSKTIGFMNKSFSQAFKENPKLHYQFESEMKSLASDPSCQRFGNNCRATLVALSMYYMQQLRPDIEGCITGKEANKHCEIESKYRKSNLEGVRNNYGAVGPGTYKKELIVVKNNTLIDVFNTVMKDGKDNFHICNEVLSGSPYRYSLDFDNEGEYNENIDPDFNPNNVLLSGCEDPKKVLHSEFIPTSIDTRASSGRDIVEPVKATIEKFFTSHPEMLITDVKVIVNASKHPHMAQVNGKKVRDPESDAKSLGQATEKLIFVQKILEEISKSSTQYTHIKFNSSAKLAGPDFSPMDMNDRWVTKMTPGYFERIKSTFEKNKDAFIKDALIKSHDDLYDEKKFPNLYLAKFKPFQGFHIEILGHVKSEMKCSAPLPAIKSVPGTTKQ